MAAAAGAAGLPCVILRVARCFPEDVLPESVTPAAGALSTANLKVELCVWCIFSFIYVCLQSKDPNRKHEHIFALADCLYPRQTLLELRVMDTCCFSGSFLSSCLSSLPSYLLK